MMVRLAFEMNTCVVAMLMFWGVFFLSFFFFLEQPCTSSLLDEQMLAKSVI